MGRGRAGGEGRRVRKAIGGVPVGEVSRRAVCLNTAAAAAERQSTECGNNGSGVKGS